LAGFRDSRAGVLGQKAIWMPAPWRVTEYTIRGKVVASPNPGRGEKGEGGGFPKSGPW
jgi:hypothetical protein